MAFPTILTAERLREVLHYDPLTGEFAWLEPGRGRRARVGCKDGDGYIVMGVEGGRYRSGRVAWFWMTGEWPEHLIDHRNRNRADNRWCNLRDATPLLNRLNCGPHRVRSDNVSGVVGVSKRNDCDRWQVYRSGKYLGLYRTLEDAMKVYAERMVAP